MRSSDRPFVSCIVVNHNKGKWLYECLRSLSLQIYRPIEVVVCENGSTDNSIDVIKAFEAFFGFRFIYRSETMGVAKAFNLALSETKGDYVAMLGADDVAKPNHLDLIMGAALDNPDVDVVYGDLDVIDARSRFVRRYSARDGEKSIFQKCSIGHATGVTKKIVYDEIGGYDENLTMSVDWEWLIRAIKAGKKIHYCGETGYQWRRIKGSDQLTMKHGLNSQERVKSHSYILKKHGLAGPCQCGCKATI